MIYTREQYDATVVMVNTLYAANDGLDTEETQELEAQLRAYEASQGLSAPKPVFAVTDERTLEWYVEKRADIASKIKRIEAQAEMMVKDLKNRDERLEALYGLQAEGVLRSLLTGKKRSHKTLHGTISLKKVPSRVKFDGLMTDLPEDLMDDVLTVKVDAVKLNRAIKVIDGVPYRSDTGEAIEINGLSVTPESEKVYIKAGAEE